MTIVTHEENVELRMMRKAKKKEEERRKKKLPYERVEDSFPRRSENG